eukprot:5527002-Alexandrium_andersonii.AAC.1
MVPAPRSTPARHRNAPWDHREVRLLRPQRALSKEQGAEDLPFTNPKAEMHAVSPIEDRGQRCCLGCGRQVPPCSLATADGGANLECTAA